MSLGVPNTIFKLYHEDSVLKPFCSYFLKLYEFKTFFQLNNVYDLVFVVLLSVLNSQVEIVFAFRWSSPKILSVFKHVCPL